MERAKNTLAKPDIPIIVIPRIDNARLRIFSMEIMDKTIEISFREKEILHHLHLGQKNEDIARQLNISLNPEKNLLKTFSPNLKSKIEPSALRKRSISD